MHFSKINAMAGKEESGLGPGWSEVFVLCGDNWGRSQEHTSETIRTFMKLGPCALPAVSQCCGSGTSMLEARENRVRGEQAVEHG